MSDLCREFGISRKTGYKIHARYNEQSVVGLYDQKRTPHRIPHRTSPELAERILTARRAHPTWGPAKLRAWLSDQEPGVRWPATSTIGELLKSAHLTRSRRVRRSVPPSPLALSSPSAANELWCIDFKGQFRLGNGHLCYPLTVTDAYSRFVLVCEGMDRIDGKQSWQELDRAFRQFGMPRAIRSDNGAPFASRGLHGISWLSAHWLALGIRHERIEPGHPEQNGRHERMHRTLKAETTRPAAKTMLSQQERFDRFCEIFNNERPHEALDQTPPARHYERSSRPYVPAGQLTYPLHDDACTVTACGHIYRPGSRRNRPRVFVSTALAGLRVGVRELSTDRWLVSFADLDLGVWDLDKRSLLSAEEASA